MKAAVCTKYGPPEVVQIQEVEKPVPSDNDVLVKVKATVVSSGDSRTHGFDVPPLPWVPYRLMAGIFAPRKNILGFTFSGEVEAIGKNVKKFQVGDQVFGSLGFDMGGHAEYASLPENGILAKKPENVSHEEAAAIPFGAGTALHFLQKGNIKEGDKVVIMGASGALGTAGVQLAKHFGAEVIGVCSGRNAELVKSLGADRVFDYTKEDFSKSGEKYDVIFDTIGKSSFWDGAKSLKENGIYLRAVHMTFVPLILGMWTGLTSNKKVIGGVAKESPENLEFLRGLHAEEKMRAVIDETYPFEEIVEAYRHVDSGHKVGNIAISFSDS